MMRLFLLLTLLLTTYRLKAQETKEFLYNICNTSELQYNLSEREKAKGVNLLSLQTALSTERYWKNGLIEFSIWGVAETDDDCITEDKLTFSNIEAENHLICSKLGYQHTIKNVKLFAGIRNVNIDYFNTPYSSLFTNSSSGIFPTISLNYGVANYPFGAFGFHAEYNNRNILIKNSFYNNIRDINDQLFFKFHFNPKRYGYTNFSQIMYTSTSGSYAGGLVLEKLPDTKINKSVYVLAEQHVMQLNQTKVGLIAQWGYAPKKGNYCYAYEGIGAVVSGIFSTKKMDSFGVILYNAKVKDLKETAIECTYQYRIASFLSIQPTIHYINNTNTKAVIGTMRAIITFGN